MLSDVYQGSNSFFNFEESFDKNAHLHAYRKQEHIPQTKQFLISVLAAQFRLVVKTITQDVGASYTWVHLSSF